VDQLFTGTQPSQGIKRALISIDLVVAAYLIPYRGGGGLPACGDPMAMVQSRSSLVMEHLKVGKTSTGHLDHDLDLDLDHF
jgi:hypothetical protein